MRTSILPTLALGLALVLLAGCGDADVISAGTSGPGKGGGEPWDRTFLSTAVTEEDRPRPLVAGTRIRLSFVEDGHRIMAQAGCNSMGGQASFKDGRLVVGDLATTEMGCDPARHAQDEWLARFLTNRPAWSTTDTTLTLDDGTTRIVLEDREVADPDRSLQGTKWVVDTIIEGESASSVPAGADAHLVFEDGDRFTGNTGCNGMGGRAVVHRDRSTITFSEVISTKMACSEDRMRVERAVLDTVDGDVTYRVEADVLHLQRADGHGLRLRAAG